MSVSLWLREWEVTGEERLEIHPYGSCLVPQACLGSGEGPIAAIADLAILSLFCGLRFRYLKMEQILLPQRHLILLLQRSSKEVTATQLSYLSTSRSPQDFFPEYRVTVDPKIFPSPPYSLLHLFYPATIISAPTPLCTHTLCFCLLPTEGADSAAKTSKLVSGWGWEWGVIERKREKRKKRDQC